MTTDVRAFDVIFPARQENNKNLFNYRQNAWKYPKNYIENGKTSKSSRA